MAHKPFKQHEEVIKQKPSKPRSLSVEQKGNEGKRVLLSECLAEEEVFEKEKSKKNMPRPQGIHYFQHHHNALLVGKA